MKTRAIKTKLSADAFKAMAANFLEKKAVKREEKGLWKVITLYHGLPVDAPDDKAEAYYNAMLGSDAGFDSIFAAHTAHVPAQGIEPNLSNYDAAKLRNTLVRKAVQSGVSVVTTVQNGDAGILKILKTAKDNGYRIELRSYLSHMGVDAPDADYDWKSHVGALEILPKLQELSDEWQLNWKRLSTTMAETAMAPYIGGSDMDSVAALTAKLNDLYPEMVQEGREVYDTVLSARRGEYTHSSSSQGAESVVSAPSTNAENSHEILLALHLGTAIGAQPTLDQPLRISASPDLRSGDFARLLRRMDTDVNRLKDSGTRAFVSLAPADRKNYATALQNLRDVVSLHVGDRALLGLTNAECSEMRFARKKFAARPV